MSAARLPQLPSTAAPPEADDARYLALKSRDARFDGQFFTAVTSTGIYCRPVCKVRTPRRENCRFFALAAQAEAAGFRPCLRCRPELAPGQSSGLAWSTQDASGLLAQQAARLLDTLPLEPAGRDHGPGARMQAVAARLGVSDRHLRRIFEAQWGVSPLQYLQTRRLLTAKQLLTDTPLPMAQLAVLSGFSSVRRFNDAFVRHYRLAPRDLRRQLPSAAPSGEPLTSGITVRASYRPPYDHAAMLEFLRQRSLSGMETVDCARGLWRRTLQISPPGRVDTGAQPGPSLRGWLEARFLPESHQVELRISDSLRSVLPQVLHRLRAALDLDADPLAIEAQLGSHFPGQAGSRVPGTVDGLELAVRAVLGQQVTVAAARTIAQRLLALGPAIETPWAGIHQGFPTATDLLQASAATLGAMGIVRQRQRAIHALAQAVAQGELLLEPGAPVAATLQALQTLPGIGPWTAHYIAMRALRWPDAFPAGDVALQLALGVRQAPKPALAAERASEAWRPWRSYAVVRAWKLLPAVSNSTSLHLSP